MTIANIGTLQDAVESFAERTFTDAVFLEWANDVADAMNNGVLSPDKRTWLCPPLRIREMLTQTTLATSGGQATLPAGWLETERLWINSADGAPDLLYMPLAQFRTHPDSILTGAPTKYTLDGSTLFIAPTSDQTLQFSYYAKLGAFTVDASYDAILTSHPGVYRLGVYAEALDWAGDPRADAERAKFYQRVHGLQGGANRAQASGSLLVARPQSVA